MRIFSLDLPDSECCDDGIDLRVFPVPPICNDGCDVKIFNLTPDGGCDIKVFDLDSEDESTIDIQLYVPGPPGPPGPPGTIPTSLELFLAWESAYASNYKTFTYTSGTLTSIDIWSDNTMTLKIFNKTFSYASGNLESIVTTRISDSATETKTFGYTSGTLTNITTVQSA